MSVCMYGTKVLIVNNGQNISFFVFLHIIEWVGMVLRIINLERHTNCMIRLKVTTILTMFLSMINQGFFLNLKPVTVDDEGISKGASVAIGVSNQLKVA